MRVLSGMCRNEVKQVSVNETIYHFDFYCCQFGVNAGFRLASTEWMRSVKLMSRASCDQSIAAVEEEQRSE